MIKYGIYIASALVGSGLGYLFYKFVGCRSGACPITSNPWLSMLMGLLFALSIASMFVDKLAK